MEYFTEQALTHREALAKIKIKYGDRAKILTQRSVRMGGFLGMFTREGVEMSGYLSNDIGRKKGFDLNEEKKKILDNLNGEKTIQQVLKELQDIKEKISGPEKRQDEEKNEHSSIKKMQELLQDNEFTFSYISDIIARIKRELSMEDLDNYTLVQHTVSEWIADRISIYPEIIKSGDAPRIIVLVGPTGVGKTTTIAKLAAMYGLGSNGSKNMSVRLITIDSYRIGAKKQIETYGEIMGIPVCCVESNDELQKKITLYQDVDLILIDTIGKSPNDFKKLAEMQELLSACGSKSEVILAVSSTTKSSDMREIVRQFEPFNYQAVILTKLDETLRIGNILSVLAEKNKPLAYITDGQTVPQDIERASVLRLLKHIEGLRINTPRMEIKYKTAEAV
ncbi:MAG: flagellar biosynthesis protein FlhF [Spirochaetales bacterium]|nr:flagellar biosynthesis protein FlhF [Spirochaetales bacterium]